MAGRQFSTYWFFYQDEKRKIPGGWKRKTKRELDEFCSNSWRKLSKDERDKYEELRLDHEKMIEDFKRINLEKEMEGKRKRAEVKSFARKYSLVETPKKDLFVIHSQIFAKTEEEKPHYVPAELSLARFSLSEGIKEVYHCFPRPGTIPIGYKRACLENSSKGHQIPLDLLSEAEEDAVSEHAKYTEDEDILDHVINILNGENNLFTLPEFEKQITGVFQTLEKRTKRKLPSLNILSLPLLMFEIANKPEHQDFIIPYESIAEREFEKEQFIFQPGMNCSWHEEKTETWHCSCARLRSWMFTMLAVCCHRYEIELLAGHHCPPV